MLLCMSVSPLEGILSISLHCVENTILAKNTTSFCVSTIPKYSYVFDQYRVMKKLFVM